MPNRLAVVVHQPFLREWEQTVEPAVDEPVGRLGFMVQKMRQCAVRQHVFPPDDGIAQHEDVLGSGHLAQPLAIEPIVLAEFVGNAVIRPGIEPFDPFPKPGRKQQDQTENEERSQPIAEQ